VGDYDFSHWDKLPRISCWCATYAREELLEEALHSFLLQDYPGEKELVILNDNPNRELIFVHPEVRIVNVQEPFAQLIEKQMCLHDLCRYEFLGAWAEDDIHLPSRLSRSVERINKGGPMLHIPDHPQNFHWYISSWWILWKMGKKAASYRLVNSSDFGAAIYSREAYEAAGTIDPTLTSCLGNVLEGKFQVLGYWSYDKDFPPDQAFYIYRRFPDHPQWYNREKTMKAGGNEHMDKYAKRGTIELKPHWKIDYALVS
jgi:glycosyltransferase involved in cell wall biosynthesis